MIERFVFRASEAEKLGRRRRLKGRMIEPKSYKPAKRGRGRRKGQNQRTTEELITESESESDYLEDLDLIEGSDTEHSDDPQDSYEMEDERMEILDFIRFVKHLNLETDLVKSDIKSIILENVPERVLRRTKKMQKMCRTRKLSDELLYRAQKLEKIVRQTRQDDQEARETGEVLRKNPEKLTEEMNMSHISKEIKNFTHIDLKGFGEIIHKIAKKKGMKKANPSSIVSIILALQQWLQSIIEDLIHASRHREELNRQYFGFPSQITKEQEAKIYQERVKLLFKQIPSGNYPVFRSLLSNQIQRLKKGINALQKKVNQGFMREEYSKRISMMHKQYKSHQSKLQRLSMKAETSSPPGVMNLCEIINKLQREKRSNSSSSNLTYYPVPARLKHHRLLKPKRVFYSIDDPVKSLGISIKIQDLEFILETHFKYKNCIKMFHKLN